MKTSQLQLLNGGGGGVKRKHLSKTDQRQKEYK
jgi:hypothetical protein